MLEGEEEQQEIENLFEKNNEGNFPNLVKEIDTQVQEAKSQTSWTQKGPHQDTSLLKCQRLKIKKESYKQKEKSIKLPTNECP